VKEAAVNFDLSAHHVVFWRDALSWATKFWYGSYEMFVGHSGASFGHSDPRSPPLT